MLESFGLNTAVGQLKLNIHEKRLAKIELNACGKLTPADSSFAQLIEQQLSSYFLSPEYTFELPILPQGTDFQQRVWQFLTQIPVGEVCTYGEIAKKLQSSARAVGNACRKNPTPIVVPCHRVVSASGLGGFAGETGGRLIQIKKMLLAHEGVKVD